METNKLEKILLDSFNKNTYDNFFKEVYEYSLVPAGKLFRPKLVYAIASDFNNDFSNDHQLLASLVEIHHTYTLMHDDLPSMDDDKTRRGRASSHIKFSEWQALLAGDGLLNTSYSLMAQMETNKLRELLKYVSWCLGPKGLILGQALDLSGEMTKSFSNTRLTHELKTARLIQASLVGSLILCRQDYQLSKYKSLHLFGKHLGLLFQFIDDLTELSEKELSDHESKVNPWPKNNEKCFDQISHSLKYIRRYLSENKTPMLEEIVNEYLKKMKTSLEKSSDIIEGHLNRSLNPAISLLD